jgi:dipeptidyl aminopeptidase/acylaminoacyl peptidase
VGGIFEADEWRSATVVEVSASEGAIAVRVHVLHDGKQLYVAFQTTTNPNGELVMPEVLVDPDSAKSVDWAPDDWWFHVSTQNCDAQGSYDDYTRCGLTRPRWLGRPNFAPDPHSIPLDAIEICPPLSMVPLAPGSPFGLALTVNAWPSEARGYWPDSASIVSPATWGDAVLSAKAVERIALDSDRDGNVEVYAMNADGSDVARITDHPAEDEGASWSPDGARLAFVSSRSGSFALWLMNADGSGPRALTQTPHLEGQPNWSPDGSRIAFVSFADGDAEICVVNADGTGFRQLTWNGCGDFEPVWLPDGEHIGWASDASGSANLYVMRDDGTDIVQLTDTPANSGYPHWSPDGARVVFCSDRSGNWEIYSMNADGTDVERLTSTDAFNGAPNWSPDGTRIAFESDRDGDREIYVMNADGSDVRQLTNNDAEDRRPSWRP